ncbi:recombinase family protein [Paenibacillus yanchengensis]|uniref:Recombinase family protein n=1 Tax=Paenibacillus yanchengensis TaxID=2035833 RepID=A0ABW4YQD9_9BACL
MKRKDCNDMQKAAIYVRVSTTKDSQKDSPEHQIAACKHYAEDMGFATEERLIYEDRESGTNITDRQAILQVIRDAQRGMFQIIIFAALSRFARDIGDSINLKRKLVNALHIRLISIDDHYDSDRDDEMLFSIISSINQSVSEQISRSTRRGKRESALRGNFTGSRPPYGYSAKKINGRNQLIPQPEQVPIVQLIYQLYTTNQLGEKAIVTYLNDQHIKAPRGGLWGVTSVSRILQNEAYAGKNRFSKFETKKVYTNVNDTAERKTVLVQKPKHLWRYAKNITTHKPIIDEATFQLAQTIRLERSKGMQGGNRQKVNLFSGIIKCYHCGCAMVTMKASSDSKLILGTEESYRYLACSKRRRQGKLGCQNALWLPYHKVRQQVLQQLAAWMQQSSTASQLLEQHRHLIKYDYEDLIEEIDRLTKQVEQKRQYLLQLRHDYWSGIFHDKQQYLLEKTFFETEIKTTKDRLHVITEQLKTAKNTSQLERTIWNDLHALLQLKLPLFDELHYVIKQLLQEIKIENNGTIHITTHFQLPIDQTTTKITSP